MKVTFCETKAGYGFKIAVGDDWLYTSKRFLRKVVNGKTKSCQFKTVEDWE